MAAVDAVFTPGSLRLGEESSGSKRTLPLDHRAVNESGFVIRR